MANTAKGKSLSNHSHTRLASDMPIISKVIDYRDGDIKIDIGNKVLVVIMNVKGKFVMENYDIPNVLFAYNGNRIMLVALKGTLGVEPFLKYEGELKITKCTAHLVGGAVTALKLLGHKKHKFTNIPEGISSGSKWDELDEKTFIGKKVGKRKITLITKNRRTKGGR